MTLVIDCHGHYTTASEPHNKWRGDQKAAFKSGQPAPAYPSISNDEIRETFEKNQILLLKERGADMARNFALEGPSITARFKQHQGGVFAEEVEVLEAQQRSVDANPAMRLRAYNVYESGVRVRRIIDRLCKQGREVA